MTDGRCFLWRFDGTPAGEYILPPDADSYPSALIVLRPTGAVYFRQDPGDAHMYREAHA